MGRRDLWDVIVNNDDVCFKHILPRLNQTDIKFLYDVNSETRALIKRSSRVDELKQAFEVDKMSSISTLEFAWNNMQWGRRDGYRVMDQAWFCEHVASTNKLELLKWAREEIKCDWNEWTIRAAAIQGNLEMIKYCVANECPCTEWTCASAALHGQLECLKYLHEEVEAPWDWRVAVWAARNGYLHILEYLVERKYNKYIPDACYNAATYGHLDCLKFLHEIAKAPWISEIVEAVHVKNHHECLQYLLDNNCPLPRGWSYDGGVLIAASESEEESEEEESEEDQD